MDIVEANVYYYGSQFCFKFHGEKINAEEFGNILFGAIANAGGFSKTELKIGGSIYSFITTGEFDDGTDSENIEKGFELYNNYKTTYSYLHN